MMIKRTSLGLLSAAVLLAAGYAAHADPPRRIVSFNLCADQLLLALADPDQIVGLSPYATDSAFSVMTAVAGRYPKLDWEAESVLNLRPDLVLVGPRSGATRSMLERLDVKVADVRLVSNLKDAQEQAREFGRLVGHPERGDALAAALGKAGSDLAAVAPNASRTALVIERGGYSEGPKSLVAAMLALAGFKPPPGSPHGFGGFISLEKLLVEAPDILVVKDPPSQAADQGALFITHPALLARYPASRRIDLPARYTLCGGPALQQGLSYLARAVKTLR